MEFRILGPLEASRDGQPISLGGAKQRALLAILLFHANEVVSTDRLIADLWGEQTPRTAASALRVHVTQLRRRLDQTRLLTRPPGYVLELDRGELDAYRFEDLVRLGERALADASFDAAARALDEALGLWRGAALADLAYEPFAGAEIARLEERRLEALEERIEADLALGRETVAIPALETIIAEHPYREGPRGQLMLALYRAGRQAEALDLYRETRRTLIDELGVAPSPALQQLERRILLHDPSLETSRDGSAPEPRRGEESTRLLTVLVALASGDEALAAAADTVLRHDGRIGTFDPDRVVATFGVPSAAEDDAERAVLAAVRLRDELTRRGYAVAIGLSTGEVHVAAGSPPAGRVVSLAERLASSAAPGRALVSAATHRLVRLAFDFRVATIEPGPVGAEPVAAYEVVRPAAAPRKTRGIEGLRAEILGRDAELAELHRVVQAVLGGRGQAVVVGGEPGVGKSRLVAELRERERIGSFRWLEGRCRASGASVSYLPYVELLTDHFGWVPEDDDRERERSIVGSVLELARRGLLDSGRVDELVTMLANLLEVDLSGGAPERLREASPEQIRHRTFAALRDYLVALAGERPVALVLEDFHWADALSLDFTALLLESLASSRLLLVCVSRPDPPHRWKRLTSLVEEAASSQACRVELTVLAPEEARALLYALLPLEGLPENAEQLILDTSQGNPFFLEELLRELIDSGAIEREDGTWTARASIDALSVPQSVQAVVLSRVDRLDADARRVVEEAAVVGRSFPVRVLAALEASRDTFERALWELESRDVVQRDRVVPEEEYSFHHVLAQEAVYRSLPRVRRADLHQSTAEAIERIYSDDLEEHVEQLAYHYERSPEFTKAVEYLSRAGVKSRRAYLNTEACAYFERGLALLDEAESADWPAGMAARLHESLGDVLELTGHHPKAIEAYSAALDVAPADDRFGRARVHRKTALSFQVQRRVDEARVALDRAEAALGPLSKPRDVWWEEWVEIALERLYVDYFFGITSEQLEASMATSRALIEKHASPRRRVDLYALTNLLRFRQRFHTADDEMIALGREAVAAAYESGSLDAIAKARHELGFYLLWAGRAAESVPESSEAFRLAERIGDLTLQCRSLAYLTDAYRMLGDVDRVREFASQTLEKAEAGNMSEYVAAARASFAWVAVREGDLAAAAAHAAAAFPVFADDSPYRALLWKVAWPLISVAFAEGRTAEAAAYAEQLLDPTRQAMPDELQRALEAVMRADGDATVRAALDTATSIATRYGYA